MKIGASLTEWLPLLGSLALKSLILFALAGAALFALRRASASARHLVCLLTLAALLALPGLSLLLPGWHLPVPLTFSAAAPAPALRVTPSEAAADGVSVQTAKETPTAFAQTPIAPRIAPSSSSLTGRTPVTEERGNKEVGWTFLPALWLFGFLLALLRPLLGLWGIAGLSRLSVLVTDTQILALAAECASALHLKTAPALRQAASSIPMTWGWRRPVILLPLEADAWPEDRLRAVLLHEFAHVRRRDWLSHRFADFVCALYWFHPFVWLAAKRLRAESEIACDDLVLTSGIAAPDYARHLLDVARALRPAASAVPQAAIAMARTTQIEGRLKMILDTTRSRRTITRRVLVAMLGAGAVVVVPLATLRPAISALPAPHQSSTSATLVGIADVTAWSKPWWDAEGKKLPQPVLDIHRNSMMQNITASSGQQGRLFAFHLLKNSQGQFPSTICQFPDEARGGFLTFLTNDGKAQMTANQMESNMVSAPWIVASYMTAIPASLTKTSLRLGVASGPWTETVNCPKIEGKVRFQRPSGEVMFTLLSNPHHLPHKQAVQGNAVFMVSDHFHSASLLKADSPLQRALHEGQNFERAVYALDRQGHVLAKLNAASNTWPDAESHPLDYQLMKTQQVTHIPNSLLKQITSFRLVARPYRWTAFKNIPLQPNS